MSQSAKKLSKSSKDLVHAAAEMFSPADIQVSFVYASNILREEEV